MNRQRAEACRNVPMRKSRGGNGGELMLLSIPESIDHRPNALVIKRRYSFLQTKCANCRKTQTQKGQRIHLQFPRSACVSQDFPQQLKAMGFQCQIGSVVRGGSKEGCERFLARAQPGFRESSVDAQGNSEEGSARTGCQTCLDLVWISPLDSRKFRFQKIAK